MSLVSNVPLCVKLSGCLEGSLVLAILCLGDWPLLASPLNFYTLRFGKDNDTY
jgi:hypothetical protein